MIIIRLYDNNNNNNNNNNINNLKEEREASTCEVKNPSPHWESNLGPVVYMTNALPPEL